MTPPGWREIIARECFSRPKEIQRLRAADRLPRCSKMRNNLLEFLRHFNVFASLAGLQDASRRSKIGWNFLVLSLCPRRRSTPETASRCTKFAGILSGYECSCAVDQLRRRLLEGFKMNEKWLKFLRNISAPPASCVDASRRK